MKHWPTRRSLTIVMMLALLLPLLAACGGKSESSPKPAAISTSTSSTNDVAQSPSKRVSSTPSSSDSETPESQDNKQDETNVRQQTPESQITLVPVESDEKASQDVSDNPWGKEIPTGPAPTSPPPPPSDFDGDGDGFYTAAELAGAIRYSFPDYTWPKNYQMTADIIIDNLQLDKRANDNFEVSGEDTIIGLYHLCAWEFSWLDAYSDGDAVLEAESLDQLQNVTLRMRMHVSLKDHLEEAFAKAALGDPSLVQQDLDTGCDRDDFITPDSGTPTASIEAQDRLVADASLALSHGDNIR